MNRIVKTIIVCAICFNSSIISAQINEYLNSENNRISNANRTETEIQKFIDDNFNNYELSQQINDDLIEHLRSEEEFTDAELQYAIKKTKVYELRKLFFVQNPDKKEDYYARPLPVEIQQQCVNGDFENGTAGYSFWSDPHPQPATGSAFFLSCATPSVQTATNVVTPVVNDMNGTVTLIDNTSPGYQQYDPTLAGLGVNIPTLYTAGANKCIKLNNEQGMGSSDQTTVSRYFPNINQATIDFNFSLIMDNKPAHGQPIQPFFRARVLDQFGNVVDEFCIIANPDNCLFNVIYVNSKRRVLYTDWICARLNVGEILNQPGTLEFTVSDCQPSAHFGTVYIDNICGSVCANPQLGALNTNPTNINCPDLSGGGPSIQVCGTYSPPVNAILTSITLNITQNGLVVGTMNAPTQLTATTFCFTVSPSAFGANPNGDFEFQIDANFEVHCPAGIFIYNITDNSANIGPDVSFNNCCLPVLTLASPADDLTNLAPIAITQRERGDWIKAANIVAVGDNALSNGVVYHAENFVELNPGFEAVFGAQFAAYPEGCTDTYVYKTQVHNTTVKPSIADETVNLIRITKDFAIIPNPSSSTIEIIMKDAKFNKVNITTIDGKIVAERNTDRTEKIQVDVSRYANGIYIINVTSEDGKLYTKKLIKN